MRISTSVALFLFLFNFSVSNAADELTVKLDLLPVKDISWDMSIIDLKNRIDRLMCIPGEDKIIHCSYTDNLIKSEFEFEDNKMSYVDVIISMPVSSDNALNSEVLKLPDLGISSFTRKVGVEPQIFDGSDRTKYVWKLEYETCQATVSKFNPNIGATMMVGCRPGSYLSEFIKKPARESFNLFDMEFGKTSKKEVLNFINKNGWHQFELKRDRVTTIIVYDNIVEGVKETKFKLFDNLLESVFYEISDTYKDKGHFYKMLVEKYGKPKEESQNYLKWIVNPDTRDEVSIFMTFANNVNNIKGISYSLKWLGQKQIESELFAMRAEYKKSEEIKKKAF